MEHKMKKSPDGILMIRKVNKVILNVMMNNIFTLMRKIALKIKNGDYILII